MRLPTDIYYARNKLYTGTGYVKSMMTEWINREVRQKKFYDSNTKQFHYKGVDWNSKKPPTVHRLESIDINGNYIWKDVTDFIFKDRMAAQGRDNEL